MPSAMIHALRALVRTGVSPLLWLQKLYLREMDHSKGRP